MKQRNQGLIEGLVINSETRSQERDAASGACRTFLT